MYSQWCYLQNRHTNLSKTFNIVMKWVEGVLITIYVNEYSCYLGLDWINISRKTNLIWWLSFFACYLMFTLQLAATKRRGSSEPRSCSCPSWQSKDVWGKCEKSHGWRLRRPTLFPKMCLTWCGGGLKTINRAPPPVSAPARPALCAESTSGSKIQTVHGVILWCICLPAFVMCGIVVVHNDMEMLL